MLQKILFFTLLFTLSHANEDILKVVYDVTTPQQKIFEKNIFKGIVANKAYYAGKFKELEVAVVVHGEAYKFFLKDLHNTEYAKDKKLLASYKNFKKRVHSLADNYDVTFYICKVGLKRHHIQENNVLDFVHIIANSTIGLIDKQNDGYAYMPVR